MSTTICIFGTGRSTGADDPVCALAYELGYALAQAGVTVANGGYGGTMEAGAKGALAAGGKVIGVTCEAFGRSGPNPYITQEIRTSTLYERVRTLVELGNGFVVLPGGTGTLLEMAMVWELKHKGFLPQHKPLWVLGDHWHRVVRAVVEQDAQSRYHIQSVDSVETIRSLVQTL